ncbi:hypothetical protein BST81_00990 [Leptolyngbya sp. 'hensonii']|uniref:glycosyltransferase family 39 protein n=1 Tax=Leptolyngbya sp. 'hensonii' TaxID=1922337 RepID=UPI00094FF274|nr:glycosyltransferase family 39 protein [Leptolyngbya sp. 'hensonii']OLP20342.1 hypothetical protein BST81_00990 [Leptolyngbya sp. 'hensonii']
MLRLLSIVGIIVILSLGIFLRVSHLDGKPIWADESVTLSVVSGYWPTDWIHRFSSGQVFTVKELLQYQYPNSDRGWGEVWKLIAEDTHPPLYPILARYWLLWFGNSVTVLRSLSVVFGLLLIPCIYWLSWELFRSPLLGLLAALLMAVSPIHIYYAQEARLYSLFTLLTLLSAIALLRAIRLKTRMAWLIYGLTLVLGLYSYLFFIFVAIGYLGYVFFLEGFCWTRTSVKSLIAFLASLIIFVPWIVVIVENYSDFKERSAWVGEQALSLTGAVRLWIQNISLAFFDPWIFPYFRLGKINPFVYILVLFVLIFVGYSLYFLCSKASKKQYGFILSLVLSTGLPLVLADLFLGGNRQTWPRYLLPVYLGIQLAVSYLLSVRITSVKTPGRVNKAWFMLGTILLVLSLFCSVIYVQADTWWNKYESGVLVQIARTIDQAEQPLVLVDLTDRPENAHPLIYHSLNPDVRVQFVAYPDSKALDFNRFDQVFVFANSNRAPISNWFNSKLSQQGYTLKQGLKFSGSGNFQGMSLYRVVPIRF